jgi:hypothetical protein
LCSLHAYTLCGLSGNQPFHLSWSSKIPLQYHCLFFLPIFILIFVILVGVILLVSCSESFLISWNSLWKHALTFLFYYLFIYLLWYLSLNYFLFPSLSLLVFSICPPKFHSAIRLLSALPCVHISILYLTLLKATGYLIFQQV